jgi:hypothetical protein
LDIHTKVTFDGLERETHLHIVLDVDIVELKPYPLQLRTFPTLTTGDDVVIDLLYLLWCEPGTDRLDNVLIVSLAVEATVDGVIIDTRYQGIVVIVEDREVLGFVVLEDYYPVMSEDFTVIGY